ncbi:hypothetical protein [Candidatus Pantoea multigeneris]|uniref:Uncharacterized protein n=1 Tax=Candidatus Pantoea multigeneris TaxID=2608357 RepID=A0ABX0R8N5_9GAMM|nr:hypothetical protein [Pantoea multigeneris]NIF20833.1 hypothetical protein [Pantoea multigeneris]
MNISSVNLSLPLNVSESLNEFSEMKLEETTVRPLAVASEMLPQPQARKGKSSGSHGPKPKKPSGYSTAYQGRASGVSTQGIQHGSRKLINMLSNRQPPTTSINQGLASGGLGDRKEINRYSLVVKTARKSVERKKLRSRNKNDAERDKFVKVKEANFRFGLISKARNSNKRNDFNVNQNSQGELINNTRLRGGSGSINLPSCLIFHDKEKAELQLKKMRLMQVGFPFCVSENAVDLFEGFFRRPLSVGEDVIFSYPVKERFSDYANLVEINKFRGMGQLLDQVPGRNSMIKGDSIYSVMSLSLLSLEQIEERKIRSENILQPDCFKIIQYQQFDGNHQFYFAYCRQSGDFYTEINAGIIPLERHENGQFSLLDEKTGYRFIGRNLPCLIHSLEAMTSMKFSPGVGGRFTQGSANHSVIPTDSTMIYISSESVTDQEGEINKLLIDRNINVFSPAFYQPQESEGILVLYPNTYVIRNNTVIFVSPDGTGGRVDFLPDDNTKNDSQYVLASEQTLPPLFSQLFSFGERYSLDKIAGEMNKQGLHKINGVDSGKINDVVSGGADFAVISGGVMTAEHLSIDYNKQEVSQKRYNSCFSYNNSRLSSIDEHGSHYLMGFVEDDQNPGFYQIDNNTRSEDFEFYQRCGFNRKKKYQVITINDMMYSKKYIKVPESELKNSDNKMPAHQDRIKM